MKQKAKVSILLASIAAGVVLGASATSLNNDTLPTGESTVAHAVNQSLSLPTENEPIPPEYVITPNGYFHPSCVVELDEYEIAIPYGDGNAIVDLRNNESSKQLLDKIKDNDLNGDNRYFADTSLTDWITDDVLASAKKIPGCQYDHFDSRGMRISNDNTFTSAENNDLLSGRLVNGWIQSANAITSPLSFVHAEWNVPPAPPSQSNQTIFLFPGIQNTSGATTIMQPVLAWFGGSWYIVSWDCCSVGTTFHSNYVPVSGPMVTGDVQGTGCNSAGVCSAWVITTRDLGSMLSTTHSTIGAGRVMNWAFGGSLEAYELATCSQLPRNPTVFSNIVFRDTQNRNLYVSLNRADASPTITPQCGYSVVIGYSSVTLNYRN